MSARILHNPRCSTSRKTLDLLRDNGIDVIVADTVGDVERAARPDTLVVAAQTFWLYDDEQLARLAALPGVMIFVTSIAFNLLADGLRNAMDVKQ